MSVQSIDLVVRINSIKDLYMPLYKFECKDCGKVVEKISKLERKFTWCPKCGSVAKRTFCAEGTSFKVNGHNEKNGYS